MPLLKRTRSFAALAGCALSMLVGDHAVQAASHREAPLIAQDPAADITDVYAFRSWEDPSKVVLIMNVIPAQEPSSGPNYFFFDDKVAYDFNLDLDRDGRAEDVVYRIRFKTKIRSPFDDLPVAYAGVDGVAGLPSPIRDLDGPDANGLGLRQTYTVTRIRDGRETNLGSGALFAVPSNIGPRTTPDYADLADRGIYTLKNGGRVFAGQRDETFYIDLGATFDTLNFRAAPILDPGQDAADNANSFGVDMFSGFNVNTIALEIPLNELVRDGNAVFGMYASTNRPRLLVQQDDGTATRPRRFRAGGPHGQSARQ